MIVQVILSQQRQSLPEFNRGICAMPRLLFFGKTCFETFAPATQRLVNGLWRGGEATL